MAEYLCKYYKERRYVSYDEGNTWQPMDEYRRGDLFEPNSPDCGAGSQIYRWRLVDNGYICDGKDKYTKYVYQVSYDGIHYYNVVPTTFKKGELVERNSSFCDNAGNGGYIETGDTPDTGTTPTIDPLKVIKCSSIQNGTLTRNDILYYSSGWELTGMTIGECVTKISDDTFNGQTYLQRIENPETLEYIGDRAFMGCSALTSINLPNSVSYIGDSAFENCSGLTNISLPSSLSGVLYDTFRNCSSLESVFIPYGIGSIDSYAFQYCTSLKSIEIPNSVSIGEYDYSTFQGCTSLTSVTLSTSMSGICESMFSDCTSLKSISMPNSVRRIKASGFKNCTSLSSATIGNNVTQIGDSAFENCTSLRNIVIPDSTTSINSNAFKNCRSMSAATVGSNVSSISTAAFENCSGLTLITMKPTEPPTTNVYANPLKNTNDCPIHIPCESIGKYQTASYWNGLKYRYIYDNDCQFDRKYMLTYDDDFEAVGACTNRSGYAAQYDHIITEQDVTDGWNHSKSAMTDASIGDCVSGITSGAFSGCTKLSAVTMSDSVELIDQGAFSGCTALSGITFSSGLTTLDTYAFQGCTALSSVTLPNSVVVIGSNVFTNCSNLSSVNIPNGVTTIGAAAFSRTKISDIAIPDTVNSIGGGVFASCGQLSGVTFGRNIAITSIPNSAFEYCTSLSSITIPDDVTTIGASAFTNCTSLSNVEMPILLRTIGIYAFYGCTALDTLTLSDSITAINDYAFANSSLKAVSIPSGLNTIDIGVFKGCTSLSSVTFSQNSNVVSIQQQAFNGCSNLQSITFPDGLQTFGYNSFENCTSLESLVLPDSVTIIGGSVFKGCTNLKSVIIGDGCTTIAYQAFSNCTSLSAVTIGSGITQIDNAFINCPLDTVIVKATTPPTLASGAFSQANIIYVPCDSVETYRNANIWSSIKRKIFGIPPCYEEMLLTAHYNDSTTYLVPCATSADAITTYETVFYAPKPSSAMTDAVIGDCAVSISGSTFKGFKSLSSVTIGNNVTTIGSDAFSGCTALKSLTIPSGVTTLSGYTFENCSSLDYIEFKSTTPPTLQHNSALYNTNNCPIYVPCDSVAAYRSASNYSGYTNNGARIIPNSSCTYEAKAVLEYANGNTIRVPYVNSTTLTSDDTKFYGSRDFISVTIGSGTTTIGQSAFEVCNIGSIDLGSGLTTIETQAFRYCSGLTSVVIPSSVTSIGNYAFNYARNLTSVTVLATTPPTLGNSVFNAYQSEYPIYVPAESVEAYKAANNWSSYASRIQAIPNS